MRSWLLPALTLSVSSTTSTASTGELVGVTATFGLGVDGSDAYFRRGTLTVDAGEPFSTQVAVEILSARYLAFFLLDPVSDFETYSMTLPLSFGTSGTKSMSVTFNDMVHSLSRTTSLVVPDPNQANITALEDEIAELRDKLNRSKSRVAQLEVSGASVGSVLPIAALALGIVGVLVAILALRATRRTRPPVSPGPPMPPAPTPSAMPSEVPPAAPLLPESPHPRVPEPPPQGGGDEAPQSGPPDEL